MNNSMRIVSLVPSLTETICDLGLRTSLIGCTSFCVRPRDIRKTVTHVGGTKDPDPDLIRSLKPTHILANQEENTKDLVLNISRDLPTLVTFPKGPQEVPEMLRSIGEFLDCHAAANDWAGRIEDALGTATKPNAQHFLYLIWQNPYMLAGPDTYISRTLAWLGWIPAYQGPDRYPAVDIKAIQDCAPEIVLMSSEPFPFRNRDAQAFLNEWPSAPRLAKIDGQLLSWFGTRTLEALQLLQGNQEHWLKSFNLPSANP